MMSVIELRVPDIGGHSDVNVAEVYVKVGDKIKLDDNLLMLETDKATMEVPAEVEGVVTEILVKPGMTISQGDLFLKVKADIAAPTQAVASGNDMISAVASPTVLAEKTTAITIPATPAANTPAAAISSTAASGQTTAVVNTEIDEVAFAKAFASPAIRHLAREVGVDLG